MSDPDGGKLERLLEGERQVSAFDVAAGGGIAARIENMSDAPEIYAVAKGRATKLTALNDAFLRGVEIGPKEKVAFRSPDGTPVEAFVTKPPGFDASRKYPTVLHIHGGPVGQFAYGYDFTAQYLASNGYVVVEPNPRGSTGRGQDYIRAIYRTWGITDYDDLIAAVDHVIGLGYADPDRLAVFGYSYGGYMTNTVITRTNRFKAAASGAGHSLIVANYGHDIYQKWYNWELGVPWENQDKYTRLSPLTQAGKVTTPTIFLGGRDDWNVPVLNAELFYQSLRQRGIETQLVVYPKTHHGGWSEEFDKDFLLRVRQWFDKHLGTTPSGSTQAATDDGRRKLTESSTPGHIGATEQHASNASIAAALEALRINRPLRAEEICREYLNRSPGSVEHLRLLGHALGKQGRYADAERTVRLAISLRSDFPHLHEDLGSMLALQQRFEEAVPCFRRAIELEPRLPLAHKKLGEALAALNRGSEADEAFEEFFELDPAKGNVALALVDLRAGRKPDAIEKLRKILRETPDNVDAMRALAGIYIRDAENLGDAEALLRRATELAPDFEAAWMMLGTLLIDVEPPRGCVRLLHQGHRARPRARRGVDRAGERARPHGQREQSRSVASARDRAQARCASTYMSLGHSLKTLGDQAGCIGGLSRRNREKSRVWRGLLEHGEPESVQVRRCRRRRHGAAAGSCRPRGTRERPLPVRAGQGVRGQAATSIRLGQYYDTGNQRQRKRVAHDPVQFEVRHEEDQERIQQGVLRTGMPVLATRRRIRSSSSVCPARARR